MQSKLSIVLLFVVLISCASSKNKTNESKTVKKQTLVISFISRGSGTNTALFTKTKELLDKSKCESSYQVKYWGREGERDICTSINSNCYKELLNELTTLIAADVRVQIKENGLCRE